MTRLEQQANRNQPSKPIFTQIVDRFWGMLMLFSPIVLMPTLGVVVGLPYEWPAFVPVTLGALGLLWALAPALRPVQTWAARQLAAREEPEATTVASDLASAIAHRPVERALSSSAMLRQVTARR